MSQVFAEAKNVAFLNCGMAWIGKCYCNRPDVQVLDFEYVVMAGTAGTSAGFNGVPMRPEKFNGVFRKDINKPQSATRHSFIYHDVSVNDATSRIT
jgi:maltoporin